MRAASPPPARNARASLTVSGPTRRKRPACDRSLYGFRRNAGGHAGLERWVARPETRHPPQGCQGPPRSLTPQRGSRRAAAGIYVCFRSSPNWRQPFRLPPQAAIRLPTQSSHSDCRRCFSKAVMSSPSRHSAKGRNRMWSIVRERAGSRFTLRAFCAVGASFKLSASLVSGRIAA